MPRNVGVPLEARKAGLPTTVNKSKPRGLIDSVVAVLQKCPDLLKAEHGSCTEACPTSSDDKNQVMCLKVKDSTYAGEEGDPLLITYPAVKHEHEVSCVCIILTDTGRRYSG